MVRVEFREALAAARLTQSEYRRFVTAFTGRQQPASTVSLWVSGRNRAPSTAYLPFAMLRFITPQALRELLYTGEPPPAIEYDENTGG